MALNTEIQINPAPIARITVGRPCTDCEEEQQEQRLAEARDKEAREEEDRVSLSGVGVASVNSESETVIEAEEGSGTEDSAGEGGSGAGLTDRTGQRLTEEEVQQVRELQARDREVRAHEAAHKGAAGQYARGGPSFEFETGPDGRRYAVGGEVQIDTAPVPDNPEATIRKAQTIRRAALAPSEPSAQDRRVAAAASSLETRARQEIQEKRREEAQGTENSDGPPSESDNADAVSGSAAGGEAQADSQESSSSGNLFERRVIRGFQNTGTEEPGRLLNLFS